MKPRSRVIITVSAFIAVLFGILMILAFSMFIVGASWITPLNPRYALADWTDEDTTATEIYTIPSKTLVPKITRPNAIKGESKSIEINEWSDIGGALEAMAN